MAQPNTNMRCHLPTSEPSLAKKASMNMHASLTPLISTRAAILILVMPRLLNYIVAAYLFLIGLVDGQGVGALRL